MQFSRWCAIVIFQPLEAIRISKTSYNDVSSFGVLIIANGFREAHTKIDLIVFPDEKPSEVIEECRLNARDFKVVKVIGRGAFGEVQLVGYSSCPFELMSDNYSS